MWNTQGTVESNDEIEQIGETTNLKRVRYFYVKYNFYNIHLYITLYVYIVFSRSNYRKLNYMSGYHLMLLLMQHILQ